MAEAQRLIGFKQLKPEYGITYCKDRLRELEKEGKFPQRVRLSATRVAWKASDLKAYLKNLGVDPATEAAAPAETPKAPAKERAGSVAVGLRDWFAGNAPSPPDTWKPGSSHVTRLAAWAYHYADEMLRIRGG